MEAAKGAAAVLKRVLLPMVECGEMARTKNKDMEIVRSALRPVVSQLHDLIHTQERETHDEFVRTVADSYPAICKLAEEKSPFPLQAWPFKTLVSDLAGVVPYIHIFLAHLSWFNGNVDGAIGILEEGVKDLDYNMNLHVWLGVLFDIDKRRPSRVIAHFEEALKIAEGILSEIPRSKATAEITVRFDNARQLLRNYLAYRLARIGEKEKTARHYAEENFKSRRNDPYYIDTLGYVKMAFAARASRPDFEGIREAKKLFEEARSYLKGTLDNKQDKVGEEKRRADMVFVEQHLLQAQELLERR